MQFKPEYDVVSTENDPTMALSNRNVAAAKADRTVRVYRIYCDGVFDLFHLAHMRMFEQAKNALGKPEKVYLLAGVCSDELVHQFKGKTVMSHAVRCESVRHCKWVDEVVAEAPWVLDDAFLEKYKIDFVAHDAIPYKDSSGQASDSGDVYTHVKKSGMFLATQRTEGISTSDIIVHIIRDYDDYVIRNLSKGYTKEQMNVGASWTVRHRFHQKEKKLLTAVEKLKEEQKQTEDAVMAFITEFNPRHLVTRSNSGSEAFFTPQIFYEHLRENLPARGSGVMHHAWGLCWSLFQTMGYFLSCLNPLAYISWGNEKLEQRA